jgi:hypothetical protein
MRTYNIFANNGISWGRNVIALFDVVLADNPTEALRMHVDRYSEKYSGIKDVHATFEDFQYFEGGDKLYEMTEPTEIQLLYHAAEQGFLHKDGQYIVVAEARLIPASHWTDTDGNPSYPDNNPPSFVYPVDLEIYFDEAEDENFPNGAWYVGQKESDHYYAERMEDALQDWRNAYPPTGEGMRNRDIDWKPYNDKLKEAP